MVATSVPSQVLALTNTIMDCDPEVYVKWTLSYSEVLLVMVFTKAIESKLKQLLKQWRICVKALKKPKGWL